MSFAAIADRHVAGDSFVHGLDPRVKLIIALAFVFSSLLTPIAHWEAFAALAMLPLAFMIASRLPPRLVLGRSLLALPFMLAAIPMLFNKEGSELFTVPIFGWTATDTGLETLGSILLRSWLCVLVVTILTATTEADKLLTGLRSLGVPRLFVSTISFMWRYIFVIGEEAQRLITARASRSAKPEGHAGGSIAWRGRVAGNMVGSLFLRSLDRSDRIYSAMLARGYNGQLKSMDRFAIQTRDIVAAAVCFAALIAIQTYARL